MDFLPKILISSSNLVPQGQPDSSDSSGSRGKLPNFKPGQIIKATVLETVSVRQARLQVLGKTILAKTGIPLVKGETILLEVSKTGQEPILKLIWNEGSGHNVSSSGTGQDVLGMLTRSEPYKVLTELLHTVKSSLQSSGKSDNISNPPEKPVQNLLTSLERAIENISLQSTSADKGLIQRLIKYGGLTLENKLGNAVHMKNETMQQLAKESSEMDMKAIALKIAEATGGKGSESGHAALKVVEFFENLQLINQYASETSGRYLLPIPILFDDLFRFGQILIDMDKKEGSKNKKEDRLIRVSLLLELSSIGDFLAEILVLKKTVSGSISVGSNDVKQLVDRDMPGLVNRLNENGFEIQNLDCRVISPETLAETSLMDKMIDTNDGLLNLIV